MNYIFPDQLSQKELQTRISKADLLFDSALLELANLLCEKKDLLLIGLTGPTCSGKTTAANMLVQHFLQNGRTVHVISLDDFYFQMDYLLTLSRKSGKQGLDYDSEETIDTDLLTTCLASLLSGKATALPHFNFSTRIRECGVCLDPKPGDLFLLEGIQILYPNVSSILQKAPYISVAVCPQSSITVGGQTFLPNEIRLMRRLVRDVAYRGSDASFTFSLWENVRRNEEKNIFPYLEKCDKTVDSTMPYEIGILKPHLIKILSDIQETDPHFSKAQTILSKIQNVESVNSNFISPNSLYREFI